MKEATRRFVDAARLHGACTLEGDAKAANAAYQSLIGALGDIRGTPDKGVAFLSGLLCDDDLSVVSWASLYLLPLDEPAALLALHGVAESGVPRLALNASMTMREWQAGRLNIE